MIPTVTIPEYVSSVRNFNLCYNSAMEVFLLPNFAAKKVGLEARWPVQVTKLGNGGARIWTSLFFSVYLMFCNWVCSRYSVTGTWGGQKALGSKGTGVGKWSPRAVCYSGCSMDQLEGVYGSITLHLVVTNSETCLVFVVEIWHGIWFCPGSSGKQWLAFGKMYLRGHLNSGRKSCKMTLGGICGIN